MTLQLISAIFALLFRFAGSGLYIVKTIRGVTHPQPVSWAIWAFTDIVDLWFILSYGGGILGVSQLIAIVLIDIFIVLLALRTGSFAMSRLDWFSVATSSLSVLVYVVLRDGVLATVVWALGSLAGWPLTVRNIWRFPAREDPTSWLLNSFSQLFSIFSLATINFVTSTNYLIWTIANCINFALIIYRRRQVRVQRRAALAV